MPADKDELMKQLLLTGLITLVATFFTIPVRANDLDDGISTYTDESISSEDSIGKKDTNISFVVIDAIAKAKMMKAKNSDGDDGDSAITNLNDNSQDSNENSVVVESGSRVDKVYNIIIEK